MGPPSGLLGVSLALTGVVCLPLADLAIAADLGRPGRYGAQDPSDEVYAVRRHNWNGFYGGVQVGYAWGDNKSTAQWGNTTNTPEVFDYPTEGAIGGLHVGYNVVAQGALFGLETDAELAGLSGSGDGSGNAIHTMDLNWAGSFRGRLGVFTTSDQLFYVTGGLAYANISVEQREKTAIGSFSQDKQLKTGWTVGAGLEQVLMAGVTARFEYRYTDFGEITYYDRSMKMRNTTDTQFHTVRAGISMKF